MSTVAKATELLGFFTPQRPELGLSELRTLAGRDKATTYRHLEALESAGLLEQDPVTKTYRIGPAVLRLAHLREATMPRKSGVLRPLETLAEATGETAHASLLTGTELTTLATRASVRHSTRVVISEETLPLHATGSGLAILAQSGDDLLQRAVAAARRYTDNTLTTPEALKAAVVQTRATGFGESVESFETGVHGIAAPIFDQTGRATGAIAVATVASRMTPDLRRLICEALTKAARAATTAWGGTVPPALETTWAATLAALPEPETSA